MDFPENSFSNASHQYVYRVPSPPRIFVPPPVRTSIDSSSTQTPQQLSWHTNLPNTSFLSSNIMTQYPKARDHVVDWTYNERHRPQMILPFLYLGGMQSTRDKEWLQDEKITMVLGVRKTMSGLGMNPRAPRELGLEIQFTDIKNDSDLISSFNRFVSLINEHLEKRFLAMKAEGIDSPEPPGRILVFCESGNERSATAVAAYIIAMSGLDVIQAVQIVQGQRFSVNIDDAARNRLHTYYSMMKAQMDVLEANRGRQVTRVEGGNQTILNVPAQTNNGTSRKRSAVRMMEDEGDAEMMDMDDRDRFERDVSAPFHDELDDDSV